MTGVLSNHALTDEPLTVMDHWRLGRLYRYPVCCVAWFCVRQFTRIPSAGSCSRNGQVWAACRFHRDAA